MKKRRIEVFTAGCPVCNPVVEMVKSIANEEYNDVTVYDLIKQYDINECVIRVEEYGITRLRAIAIDGKLLECCKNNAITREDLISSGLAEKI